MLQLLNRHFQGDQNKKVQGAPLATEPGISLILLTPMKILQRNLNRSTFVVWEMKRNVSVVRLIVVTTSSGPPASQPVSCLTRLSASLSVCRLIISYGDIWKGEFTKTNHEPQTPWKQTSPKKFRQWERTYWQGLSKIWRAGFNPVWTQMMATCSTCYDVVTFLIQWGKSASDLVAISSLVVKLLKKCRVR